MITRLEVDGFKNLVGFSLDLGPFTCIAGPNSVGKSNIFDAIQFLASLADNSLTEAALKTRGADPETSHIQDLFWTDGRNPRRDWFRMAVEMIVDGHVNDDFGRPAEASSTFLRYEVRVRYAPPSSDAGLLGRLVLEEEKLDYITEGNAWKKMRFPHSAKEFRGAVVKNRRTRSGFISVNIAPDGKREIVVHQDGGARGPGQTAPADSAPRTIVGTSNTSATPTILAVRREMQNWRLLALEPSAMRKPDRFHSDPHVTVNGGHLPATIHRLASETKRKGGDEEDLYAEIATRLSELTSVTALNVTTDEVRQLLTLEVTEASGIRIPANSLSDGTLRFLALAIVAADPEARGLICMEEPENGIHPAKIGAMVDLLRDIAVDVTMPPGEDNPLRQVIVATHSPAFVRLQNPDDLVFALEATVQSDDGVPIDVLRCRPLADTWRANHTGQSVGQATILAYLTAPPEAQLSLPGLGKDP